MKKKKLSAQELEDIAFMLKALSDPTRLKIMQSLHEGELCVGDIVRNVGTGQANISKHLQILVRVYLLKARREKNIIYYSLAGSFVSNFCDSICKGYTTVLSKKYGKQFQKGDQA